MERELIEQLWSLVVDAAGSGRGRMDSGDWISTDLRDYRWRFLQLTGAMPTSDLGDGILKDPDSIVEELSRSWGGKILLLPEQNPTEIICEIGPEEGAIAVIGRSKRHYHKKSTETYRMVRGKLQVFVDGVEHVLGDTTHLHEDGVEHELVIAPGQLHWAYGGSEGAWVRVTCDPPWTAADHILRERQ